MQDFNHPLGYVIGVSPIARRNLEDVGAFVPDVA